MLTENQKKLLENKIYRLIKESMFENDLFEKSKKKKHKYDNENNSEKRHDDKMAKRDSVMKWLDTAQELHSVLSYELWPDIDEDTARSLFSKKFRGEDADGKPYDFDDDEINKLYNMKDSYIDDIS